MARLLESRYHLLQLTSRLIHYPNGIRNPDPMPSLPEIVDEIPRQGTPPSLTWIVETSDDFGRRQQRDSNTGNTSELTWIVETSDDFERRQRRDSMDSLTSYNSSSSFRLARQKVLSDCGMVSLSLPSSCDSTLYSLESEYMVDAKLVSAPKWTRPWRLQE
ncbi:hypothetical protein NOR_00836 [Metarhizium rileyi]|uniref:Uncharacterized protein n=1 Tax=Metarhizium rileyi (strain RCEF 4871) TaxID=1649241 RepID=A0A167JJW6_METRR|nr:hypothetical protein NOR_00836 [Metarhizium rileyi RCEF 4871]TWU75747.1 hypothetical protein ED733_001646 [Metarhizium rileyi]